LSKFDQAVGALDAAAGDGPYVGQADPSGGSAWRWSVI